MDPHTARGGNVWHLGVTERTLEPHPDTGEIQQLRMIHAGYFAELARKAEPEIFVDDQDWPDRLDLEHDNLRAALQRFIDAGEIQEGLAMATCLWRFWQIRAHLAEGRAWLTQLLDIPKSKDDPAIRGAAISEEADASVWGVAKR